MVIRRAVDTYLSREDRDTAAWQAQWNRAIEGTAGIASYLEGGDEYVEDLRGKDAERLSRFET
jgi:hypothetical protein